MYRTWTTAIAVMALLPGAHGVPAQAEELPEAHTIIGEEHACRDVPPHRADDTTWQSAVRRVCEAVEQTHRLVTRIAENARAGGGDGDAAAQAAARLTEIRAGCGQPCDDAYEEALSALDGEDREVVGNALYRASQSVVQEPRLRRAPPTASAQPSVRRAPGAATSQAPRAYLATSPSAHRRAAAALAAHAPAARFGGRAPGPIRRTEPGSADQVTLDTDTGAWPLARQRSAWGMEVPAEAVRPEEWVHYFEQEGSTNEGPEPVALRIETMPAPWNAKTVLLRIGLHARHDEAAATAPIALTWIIDRSGSMSPVQRFPMLTAALRRQVGKLPPGSSIAIAAYANEVEIFLEPTTDRAKALAAVERLRAEGPGGGTGGEAGVARAIALAQAHPQGRRNVIVLATDGDFNLGASEPEDVEALAERCRDAGSELHVVLVGQDNVRDDIGQALAQAGNGRGYYADRLDEAHAILARHLLRPPVGRDVKVRFEPNPARVAEYRRIGLETREITEDEFMDEATDGGELAAGDAASVWYELVPHDSSWRYLPGRRIPRAGWTSRRAESSGRCRCGPGPARGRSSWAHGSPPAKGRRPMAGGSRRCCAARSRCAPRSGAQATTGAPSTARRSRWSARSGEHRPSAGRASSCSISCTSTRARADVVAGCRQALVPTAMPRRTPFKVVASP